MKQRIVEAMDRICQMESCFDALQKLADQNPDFFLEDASAREMLHSLVQYYEGGQWLEDYALDEQGLLPQDLKRGVLAQDAVYDFLERILYQE